MPVEYNAPAWLDRSGREYWRRVAPSLAKEGILTAATFDLLACAAQAYSSYREATKKLREDGPVLTTKTGAVKPSPWLSVQKQAFEVLARVARELRIAENPADADDELDAFLASEDKS